MGLRCFNFSLDPIQPFHLGGSGNTALQQPASAGLEANVIVVTGKGDALVLAQFDLLFVGAPLLQALHRICQAALGAYQLVAVASHTHFAPATDPKMWRIGQSSPDYVSTLAERFEIALQQSLKTPPAHHSIVATRQGLCAANICRRDRRWRSVGGWPRRVTALQPNVTAPVDDRLHLWVIHQKDRPVAAIWRWTCHPTFFADPTKLSAEFPGMVRSALRDTFGNIPVLFLQGPAGDVRPAILGENRGLKGRVRKFFDGPYWAPRSAARWHGWSSAIASTVTQLAQTLPSSTGALAPTPTVSTTSVPLAGLLQEYDGSGALSIKRLQMSPLPDLYFFSAEVLSKYTSVLAKTVDSEALLCGYEGDVFGYLPHDHDIAEGGYEVTGFLENFSLDGRFAPGTTARIAAALQSLSG